MQKKMIIVRGYNGSGKSTTARLLSIKHRLFVIGTDTFGWEMQPYREKSLLDGRVAQQTIEACLGIFLETGQGVVIDGTLAPLRDKKDRINPDLFIEYAEKSGYDVLPILLTVTDEVIQKRYVRRQKLDPRATPPDMDYVANVKSRIAATPMKGQIVINTTTLKQEEVLAEIEKHL